MARILLVEDDADFRELVQMTLEIAGFQVAAVDTLAAAVELARAQAFDLYVLDNRLPDGDGQELCQRIRRFDPRQPILFLSGEARSARVQEMISCGAQACLIKPVDPDEIVATVGLLLDPPPGPLP